MTRHNKLISMLLYMEIEEERRQAEYRRQFLINQRRRKNKQISLIVQEIMKFVSSNYLTSHRTLWMKPRHYCQWFEKVMLQFGDDDFIANFRMDRATFLEVCSLVNDDLRPKPAIMCPREPLSTAKQVAIALYKLASCSEMRVIGNNMGVSTSTVHKCIRRFTLAMLKHLSKFIYIPTLEEAVKISEKFEQISSMPQILMVIDGTHIPVLAPTVGYGDFVNRKGWTSFNVQITADVDYMIRDVSCQYPGATHDAFVFKNSGLYQYADTCIPKNPKPIDGELIDYFLIGDPAYPLLNWLIKGYSGSLTPEQESFNAYMNSARIVVEQTIGKLKARWRVCRKYIEMDYRFVPKLIMVCCILHNIVQAKKLPTPTTESDNEGFAQPSKASITCSNRESQSNGCILREKLLTIIKQQPLRKQIVLKKK